MSGAWGSKDSQVHVANGLGRKIYVFVTPSPTWVWADVAAIPVLMAVVAAATASSGGAGAGAGAELVTSAVELSRMAKTIQSAKELFDVIKTYRAFRAAKMAYDAANIAGKIKLASDVTQAMAMANECEATVKKLVEPIKLASVEIRPGDWALVNSTDYSKAYNALNPSYWAALAGADTVQLTVFTEDLEQITTFTTGADLSWVATEVGVVRVKYGTLWDEDRNEGWNDWNGSADQPHVPVIYEHRDFAGSCQALPVGSYLAKDLLIGNKKLSSLRVPNGWKVTAYRDDNYRGPCAIFTGDTSYVGDAANDSVSSIVVTGPALAGVAIYSEANYQGRERVLAPGRYDVDMLGIGNDKLSSLRVPQGWSITLFCEANFKGSSTTFSCDSPYVGDAFNDKTSSFDVRSPTMSGVVIYRDRDYNGASQVLAVGRYDTGTISIGNDKLSSLRVPPGFCVTLHEDSGFRGNSLRLTKDTSYVGDMWNDRTSSLEVEFDPRSIGSAQSGGASPAPVVAPAPSPVAVPAPGGVTIYADVNYMGVSQVLSVGRYDMKQLTIGNDVLSSMRIPPRWRVTLYEDAGFRGKAFTFTQDTANVGGAWNDRASSIDVSYG